MTLITYLSIIEIHGMLSLIHSIHPIQSRLLHYFDEYTIGLVSYWKTEPEDQFQRQKMGRFLNRFTGKNQFLFHESKLLYQSNHYSKNYHPSTLGSMTDQENCHFFGQTPYNFDLP